MAELRRVEDVVLGLVSGEGGFGGVLREVVEYQRKWNPALSAFWERQGFDAEGVADTELVNAVPAVPTDVFRHVELRSREGVVTKVFRTSGTTHGARGAAYRLSTRVYDVGAVRQFRDGVLRTEKPARFSSLLQSPEAVADSSLVHMVEVLRQAEGVEADWLLSEGGVDVDGLVAAVAKAEGRPIVLFTTAFAMVELLDQARGEIPLGSGSFVVETGGFKGRTRELGRRELYEGIRDVFRISMDRIRSEYSMTELSSQLYSRPTKRVEEQVLVPPSWCRVAAVDPETLEVLPTGAEGLLRFVDLANVDTVVAVQTSDLGVLNDDGSVRLFGRAPGATPRGCSLAAEELMDVVRARRGAR